MHDACSGSFGWGLGTVDVRRQLRAACINEPEMYYACSGSFGWGLGTVAMSYYVVESNDFTYGSYTSNSSEWVRSTHYSV